MGYIEAAEEGASRRAATNEERLLSFGPADRQTGELADQIMG
jgi:hypothetical protein